MPEDNKQQAALSPEPLPPDHTEDKTAPAERETAPDGKGKKKKEKLSFAANCCGWLQALSMALVILLVVFTFFGRIIGVDGSSMYPTLENGDLLFVRCLGYDPEPGDIVVLHKDFGSIHSPIVKRVIAVGGQTVEIDYSTSTVYVDGEPLDEPYRNEEIMNRPDSPEEQQTYWEVPEGSIFVMGDNRNASTDSRNAQLNVVDERYVIGEVLCTLFPIQSAGTVQ